MRWYLTSPEREFSEWNSLAIGTYTGNVSLPTDEPTEFLMTEEWQLLPLIDEPPVISDSEIIDSRVIEINDEEARAIYSVRNKTTEEIRDKLLQTASQNILSAPTTGFGGPTGKEVFNGNQ